MQPRMFTRYTVFLQERKWEIALFCLIITLGIFFRTYNFSDWLHFEVDQSYDVEIVSHAVENGIENLPLLGPTAGGGRALRLGPVFYYMEYVSGLLFGDTPTGYAMVVLILSILSLPLFYFFCRRYFSVSLSLSLLAIFSLSVLLILYGRFSWSPNVLPFFILLAFYALLRSTAVSEAESVRNRFFLLSMAAIAIVSQIHFNAFFTIPTIATLFLLYKRPTFPIRIWIFAAGIFFLAYSPMILSDIHTRGENIGFFFKKISKQSEPPYIDFVRKSVVTLQYSASGYLFSVTGIDVINGKRVADYGFQNNEKLPWRILAIVLLAPQSILLLLALYREKDADRKDFLVLILLWVTIPLLYFYSLVSNNVHFYPRFYLLIAPVAIISFGFLLQLIHPEKSHQRKLILAIITFLILIPNVRRTENHFWMLANPEKNETVAEREDIFPNDNRLTQKEQLAITDFLAEEQKKNGFPIYLDTYSEYESILWYHLGKKGIYFEEKIDGNHLHRDGNYFLIQYKDARTKPTEEAFIITEEKRFGALTVYTLVPKEQNIKPIEKLSKSKTELLQTAQIRDLTTWKTFFSKE